MRPKQQIDEERNDGWRPTSVILLSWLCADTRSQDRGPLHCNRLGGSLSVPCSLQTLMPDDASLAALGAGTAVGNKIFESTLSSM
jgi:hypothetical protein